MFFCGATLLNASLVPSKLERHLQTHHPEHKNKSNQFFSEKLKSIFAQQSSLQNIVKTGAHDKPLVIASLKMTHVILREKRSYMDMEKIVKPCLSIAAEYLHGGSRAVERVTSIPLSDTTIRSRCLLIATDLKAQLVEKLKASPVFGIQLDETTDIGGEAQLIVYTRFIEELKIVDRFLFCLTVGIETTAQAIFDRLDSFMCEEGIEWIKCKAVTTDGAAAMVGRVNGVVKKIQTVSPEGCSIHCIIHREMLAAKKLGDEGKSDLELVLDDVVKMVNTVKANTKKSRLFAQLCEEMDSEVTKLLYHCDVRWLSRGKVLERVLLLREELAVSSQSLVISAPST